MPPGKFSKAESAYALRGIARSLARQQAEQERAALIESWLTPEQRRLLAENAAKERTQCTSCGALTGHTGICASDARYGN